MPINGGTADIVTSQSAAPNNPVLQAGIQPASGYLTHVIVGNGSTGAGVNPKLEINGGQLNVEWFNICWDAPPTVTSSVEMTDGTVNVLHGSGHFALGISGGTYGATAGPAYFTQSGGTVNSLVAIFGWDNSYAEANLLGGEFNISTSMHMWPTGRLNIDGGTLNVLSGAGFNLNGIINITSGAFIIDGDVTATVSDWVASGIIIANGGTGQVAYNYNKSNPGKTTVFAWDDPSPTVAHWRFEEGSAGVEHPADLDSFYQDLSGNGNPLSSTESFRRPMATADRSFSSLPVNGCANNLALDFDGNDHLRTSGSSLDSYMFNNGWTVECTFKLDAYGWRILVGKDGQRGDLGGAVGVEAPFWLKMIAVNNHLECLVLDDTDNFHWLQTLAPIDLGKWYSVAATFDDENIFRLYLKGEGDADYILQNAVRLNNGVTLGGYNNFWTVGRGRHNGNPVDWFDGIIDEVRISDGALDPVSFIAAPFGDLDADGDLFADAWELRYAGNVGELVPWEDSDGDGLDNFSEYGLGGNPMDSDDAGYAPIVSVSNGIEVVYAHRTLPPGQMAYTVETTVDLLSGVWTNTGYVEVSTTGINDEFEAATYWVADDGSSNKFARLLMGLEPISATINPYPADSAVGETTNTFSWGAVPSASGYDIYFGTDEALVDAGDPSALWAAGYTGTSVPDIGLDLYTDYYWKVVPISDNPYIVYEPSDVWHFKPTIPSELGRGHKLFIKRGFMTGAVVFPGDWATLSYPDGENVDWDTWTDSGFNTVCTHLSWLYQLPSYRSDLNYIRWAGYSQEPGRMPAGQGYTNLLTGANEATLSPWEEHLGYGDNLVAIQAADEVNLSDQDWRDAFKAAFDRWKVQYPNTLVFTSQFSTESDSGVLGYQKFCQPDMLMSFIYPVFGHGDKDEQWEFWKGFVDYRELAKKGINSTDYVEPIPYGCYFEAYRNSEPGGSHHVLSGSELSLSQWAPVAFGYKMTIAWCYAADGGANLDAVIFDGLGDQNTNALFGVIAENNRQLKLMGESLVRLNSTSTWEIGDVDDDDGGWLDDDENIPGYSSGNIPDITGVSFATGRGGIISRFEPLHEDFDGSSYSNQTYFMVVNGNFSSSGTPAAQASNVTLTIGGGITALESINLTTGLVETLPVTSGTVTFSLDGGRGKLFKFQTGAPFVGFYNGE